MLKKKASQRSWRDCLGEDEVWGRFQRRAHEKERRRRLGKGRRAALFHRGKSTAKRKIKIFICQNTSRFGSVYPGTSCIKLNDGLKCYRQTLKY